MWSFKKSKPTVQSSDSGEDLRALTFVPPDVLEKLGGLPTVAIYGFRVGDSEEFRPNAAFLEFLHSVIKRYVCADPAAQAHARRQRRGSLSIIDLRTPEGPMGRVPLEDILGAFDIKEGELKPENYHANDEYVIFSRNGPPVLPEDLQAAFVSEVMKLSGGLKMVT
jgi:hypothetical protein